MNLKSNSAFINDFNSPRSFFKEFPTHFIIINFNII